MNWLTQLKDSGAETIIVMESFAKTLQDALPGTSIKRIVITQLGDLLSDGINLKGRLVNFCLAPYGQDGSGLQAPRWCAA